jgi:hypothetical protein
MCEPLLLLQPLTPLLLQCGHRCCKACLRRAVQQRLDQDQAAEAAAKAAAAKAGPSLARVHSNGARLAPNGFGGGRGGGGQRPPASQVQSLAPVTRHSAC